MKMALFKIKIINWIISMIDMIVFPINFLIYKNPLRALTKSKSRVEYPHEFIYCADMTQVILKPALPEATCANKEIMSKENLNTIAKVFDYSVKKYQEQDCLGTRKIIGIQQIVDDDNSDDGKIFTKMILDNKYQWQSYREISQRVTNVSKGLTSIGLKATDKVLIYADTCAEWMITALACFKSSIIIVTLYTNLGNDGIIHGVNQVSTNILVTSETLLPKILELTHKLPSLRTIIVIENDYNEDKKEIRTMKNCNLVSIVPFNQLETKGSQMNNSIELIEPEPETIAMIMYTSGSTGDPKGVILTHLNVTSSLMACCPRACNLMGHERHPEESYLGYLPLAHIFELTQEFIVLFNGCKIGYSSPYTLTDSSSAIMPGHKGDMSVLKPSIMPAVPLVLDRIYKSIRTKIAIKGQFFQELFDYFVEYRNYWIKKGYDTPLLNRVLFAKIRSLFGGQLKTIIAGGAPLSPEVHDYLRSCLGINLAQGYGLTETVGGVTLSTAEDLSSGRVGQALPGVRIKLQDWDEGGYKVFHQTGHGPRGEILIGGPMISSGYYDLREKTTESFIIDPYDGLRWFKTGDIGQLDSNDGGLKLIDRKKDLVKLQMGEYLSLGKVEAWLKIHPLVDSICVIADTSKSYCIALIVPDSGKLSELAKSRNICSSTFADLCLHPDIIGIMTQQIQEHGNLHLTKFEIPKRIALLSEQWTPDTGLVTAAMKLKRKPIFEKYDWLIRELYNDEKYETISGEKNYEANQSLAKMKHA